MPHRVARCQTFVERLHRLCLVPECDRPLHQGRATAMFCRKHWRRIARVCRQRLTTLRDLGLEAGTHPTPEFRQYAESCRRLAEGEVPGETARGRGVDVEVVRE